MTKICCIISLIGFSFVLAAIYSSRTQSAALPALTSKGIASMDQFLADTVAKQELPGLVAAVVNKDQILYLKAFGKQNVGQNIPMTKDTIFRIASMTKPVTSVAIMMLVEQGNIRLDDPISKYLPEYKGREVIATFNEKDGSYTTRPAKQEITIRHLLAHTSGLGYDFTSPTVAALLKKTGKGEHELPLLFDPGTQWLYSTSPAVLGDLLKKLSGQSLEQHFKEKVFQPLQMPDTSFYVPEDKLSRLVTKHKRGGAKLTETPNPAKFTAFESGEGGLNATAADYAAFVQMLLNQGSRGSARLLKPESIRQMISNQIGPVIVSEMPAVMPELSAAFPFGAGKDKFGLGFQITMTEGKARHERSAGSYAWAGIYNTHFWVDPKRGIGVIFLSQDLPFYNTTTMGLMRQFEHLVYAHLQ
ncbi:MAG: serine hydrolase domain-containing protein [Acidobacteriota bacterium]